MTLITEWMTIILMRTIIMEWIHHFQNRFCPWNRFSSFICFIWVTWWFGRWFITELIFSNKKEKNEKQSKLLYVRSAQILIMNLNIPGDSSPPLATPGSDVSLRSEIDETFRRDWIESVRRTKMEWTVLNKLVQKIFLIQSKSLTVWFKIFAFFSSSSKF